ncbi:MAG: hypothetical protein ISS68_14390 [Desulfobacteraceae bacterium]|nr:hypothetical protein [Desulfobacteraceae bacterium]MBL7203093.1 hypothetical protein [Desulfobacteraceae bacterium]
MTVTLKILLINPPYLTLTSLLATGHQIPLGLLWLGELIWELLGIRCARHATKVMRPNQSQRRTEKIWSRSRNLMENLQYPGDLGVSC